MRAPALMPFPDSNTHQSVPSFSVDKQNIDVIFASTSMMYNPAKAIFDL
jgi:hypothetical protein